MCVDAARRGAINRRLSPPPTRVPQQHSISETRRRPSAHPCLAYPPRAELASHRRRRENGKGRDRRTARGGGHGDRRLHQGVRQGRQAHRHQGDIDSSTYNPPPLLPSAYFPSPSSSRRRAFGDARRHLVSWRMPPYPVRLLSWRAILVPSWERFLSEEKFERGFICGTWACRLADFNLWCHVAWRSLIFGVFWKKCQHHFFFLKWIFRKYYPESISNGWCNSGKIFLELFDVKNCFRISFSTSNSKHTRDFSVYCFFAGFHSAEWVACEYTDGETLVRVKQWKLVLCCAWDYCHGYYTLIYCQCYCPCPFPWLHLFTGHNCWVIQVGTAVVTGQDGRLAMGRLGSLCEQVIF
jgi:hypothetical protein